MAKSSFGQGGDGRDSFPQLPGMPVKPNTFDFPDVHPASAWLVEGEELADLGAEMADLEDRAAAARTEEELKPLRREYARLQGEIENAWLRRFATGPAWRDFYREHRRPCSTGCGRQAAHGRVCETCHKSKVRARDRARALAEQLRYDEFDRLDAERAGRLDLMTQVDLVNLSPPPAI